MSGPGTGFLGPAQRGTGPDGDQPVPAVLRWRARPERADGALLARCTGATVEIGCGPGPLVLALATRGVVTLGIDTSPRAVRLATQRGAMALRRDVFDRLPGEGRWRHVLLTGASIGIGGNPVDLLSRCAELITAGGTLLVEVDPAAQGVRRCLATIEHDLDREPFRWASIGADTVPALATATGLAVTAQWRQDGRSFAELTVR